MGNQNFAPGHAISTGWKLTKENLMVMVGLLLMGGVIIFVASALGGSDVKSAQYCIMYVVSMLISWYFSLGYSKISLDLADGEEAEFSAFGKVLPLFIKYIVTSILINLIILIGFLILFIPGIVSFFVLFPDIAQQFAGLGENPAAIVSLLFSGIGLSLFLCLLIFSVLGIYLGLRLSYAGLAIISDKCGPMEALRKSWIMTKGRTGKLFVMYLLLTLINILGILALFIGVFVTLTISQLAYAASYRQIEKDMAVPSDSNDMDSVQVVTEP